LYNPDGTLHQRYSSSGVVVINCVAGNDGNCQLTQSGPYKLVIADVSSNEVGDYQIEFSGSPQAIVAGSSFDWPLNIDGGLPILTQDHSDLGQVVENKFHAGVDLLNMGPDNTIYAANVGIVHSTVTGCENNVDACGNRFGNYVIIRHDGQFYEGKVIYSLYAHLAPNSITVSKDQVVTKGMPIGILGATGKVSGPHLHFETSVNSGLGVFAYTNSHPIGDDYLDPWAYLNATKIPPTVIQINEGPNLNIRNKPGVDLSLVVAAAERNQMFVSFASIRKGNGDIWHRIHLPCGQKRSNCAGWLATKFEGESNVSVQGANLIAVAIDAGINGSDIYTVPNTSASVIDTMFDTQSFAVREIAEPGSGCDSSWYKIDLPNTFGMLEGWVCGDDVQLF
jgi:murein DD-endopeptidase MepM/ murein hydrolase activator NlpD